MLIAHCPSFCLSVNSFSSSPLWCMDIKMSAPPTNSPSTNTCAQRSKCFYLQTHHVKPCNICMNSQIRQANTKLRLIATTDFTCGIVGQLVNFLIPSRTAGSASTLRLPYCTPARVMGISSHVKLTDCLLISLGVALAIKIPERTICVENSANHVTEPTHRCGRVTLQKHDLLVSCCCSHSKDLHDIQ